MTTRPYQKWVEGPWPSEQIALLVSDCDLNQAKSKVTKARVMARDKDRTKISEDRLIELCPRALEVLKRQLVALRARLNLAGRIFHDVFFFDEGGKTWHDLQTPWKRWNRTLSALNCRYREPYNARHTSVS